MKEFTVRITETSSMDVTVEAENMAQAKQIAEQNWNKSQYILDYENFKNVSFTVPQKRNYER